MALKVINMFDSYWQPLKYEEFIKLESNGTPKYKDAVIVKGLRLSGRLKITHTESGDITDSSVIYKTKEKLIKGSKLEDREIMERVRVEAFGLDAGYLNYLK